MKFIYIVIISLLFSSCANTRKLVKDQPSKPICPKCIDSSFLQKIENCMMKFSKQGFEADAVVKICGKIYERRN